MFRIAKQLEISRLIFQCQTAKALCQWSKVIVIYTDDIKLIDAQFKIITNQICLEEGKRIVSNAFIKHKSKFSNHSIDQLLTLGSNQLQLIDKHINTYNINICQLDYSPNGVLGHISQYLSLRSNLQLSVVSHSFHKKIQNHQYFQLIRNRQKSKKIRLNPRMLHTINKNNCIVECMHKYTWIEISGSYSNSRCTNCPLSRLIDKINHTKNYDLVWFRYIWNNMTVIYISNDYSCALQHIPMSWILQHSHGQASKPIEVIASQNIPGNTLMNKTIVKNFAKCVKKYINDNPSKNIRKIQRIWYDDECDMIEIYSLFGNNLTGIMLDLPRLWDNKCRFEDLDTFFKIFHENVDWLEIAMECYDNDNFNVVAQLFKNNQQLFDDLNKTEKQMPFNQFLKKYNCQNKRLPQIKHLAIVFGKLVVYHQSTLFKLLYHDKIIKLLNLQGSVNCFSILFGEAADLTAHNVGIENVIELTIPRFDNLEECWYTLDATYFMNQAALQKFFHLVNVTLFQMAMHMKPTMKCVHLLVWTQGQNYHEYDSLEYKIKIEDKNELLYCNQHLLRKKISLIVDNSIQDVKKYCSIKIKQCFKIESAYSV